MQSFFATHMLIFHKTILCQKLRHSSCCFFSSNTALDDNRAKLDFTQKNCTRIKLFSLDFYQQHETTDFTTEPTTVIPCEYKTLSSCYIAWIFRRTCIHCRIGSGFSRLVAAITAITAETTLLSSSALYVCRREWQQKSGSTNTRKLKFQVEKYNLLPRWFKKEFQASVNFGFHKSRGNWMGTYDELCDEGNSEWRILCT